MKTVAIIPARGGSKRLPRKNVLPFLGKPIIAHTIGEAKAANIFADIVVSSEDDEIIRVAETCGVSFDRRAIELATDSATVVDVCVEYLNRPAIRDLHYDALCVLYATAPLRTAEDMRATISLLDRDGCDYAIAATAYTHYPHQALQIDSNGYVQPRWPDLYRTRATDLPPVVAGNGTTYCVWVDVFLQTKTFVGERTRTYVMPFERSIDIDEVEDFKLTETIALGARRSC